MKRPSIFRNTSQSPFGCNPALDLSQAPFVTGSLRQRFVKRKGTEFSLVDSVGEPKFPQPFVAISRDDEVSSTYQ